MKKIVNDLLNNWHPVLLFGRLFSIQRIVEFPSSTSIVFFAAFKRILLFFSTSLALNHFSKRW